MFLKRFYLKLFFNKVNFFFIYESSLFFWLLISLEFEEFFFLFQKDAFFFLSKLFPFFVNFCFNFFLFDDLLRILIFFEIKCLFFVSNQIVFSSDNVFLKNTNNLTLLEKELGFIRRLAPVIPSDYLFSEFCFYDSILKASLFQRKLYKEKLINVFYKIRKFYFFICNLFFFFLIKYMLSFLFFNFLILF